MSYSIQMLSPKTALQTSCFLASYLADLDNRPLVAITVISQGEQARGFAWLNLIFRLPKTVNSFLRHLSLMWPLNDREAWNQAQGHRPP